MKTHLLLPALLGAAFIFPICSSAQTAIDPTTAKPVTVPTAVNTNASPSGKRKPAATTSHFTHHAHGSFDVKVTPLSLYDKSAPTTLSRRAVERQIHGDFEGVSKGEMLVAKTKVDGSEAYCAMEYISGALKGRKGSFILQHKGIMRKGKLDIVLSVVPDSGTDELAGLDGVLKIDVTEGKHYYDFAYTLPASAKK